MRDRLAWDHLQSFKDEQTVLTVTVDCGKQGIVAYVEGIRGFIPASRLALGRIEDLNTYLGKEIQVQVADVDEEKNRLILSCRELLRAKEVEERQAKISAVAVSTIMKIAVENISLTVHLSISGIT